MTKNPDIKYKAAFTQIGKHITEENYIMKNIFKNSAFFIETYTANLMETMRDCVFTIQRLRKRITFFFFFGTQRT